MRVVVVLLAVVALMAGSSAALGQDERSIPVTAGSGSNWIATGEQSTGQPCVLMNDQNRPHVLVVENEKHEVIQVWRVTGTLFQTDAGDLRCNAQVDVSVPDASFYQVFLNGEFVAAYAAADFPISEEWSLLLFLDMD